MQTQQTITLFGTVSNSATSRISKNGRKYIAFGVAISDRNPRLFITTSLPSASRATSPSLSRPAPASSWSCGRNPNHTA